MQPTQRPRGVWAILIYYALSLAWTLLSFWLIYSEKIAVPDATAEYLRNPGTLTRALTIVGIMLNGAFLVALFQMRRIARTIFTTILILTVFSFLWNILFTNYLSVLTVSSLVGLVVAGLIFVLIYRYLFRLERDGKLT
jgi:hypothetical protein